LDDLIRTIDGFLNTKSDIHLSMASSSHSCSGCGKEVRPRQHALLCDNCHQWRHRVCDTNMTQEMYSCS
ncbi:hypothetical protein O3P69_012725, partial [Scylla paramamosain]